MTEKQIQQLINQFEKGEEKQVKTLEKLFLAMVDRKGNPHLKIGREVWSTNLFNDYRRSGNQALKFDNIVRGMARDVDVISLGDD